ncbi:MAG: PQQ-binding-like beta-propeller repeat protein [Planctomycetes bacterium]|nr:PQQ-binding-like beta-propeller repeat protein [Planctomycetota bacterium]
MYIRRNQKVVRVLLAALALVALVQWVVLSRQMLGGLRMDYQLTRAEVVAASATEASPPLGDQALSNWPQWRGPLATGVAPQADPPVRWSEQENIRWKLSPPGKGHSTPIVWDNHIFLTAAAPVGEAQEPRYSGAPGAHDNAPITHRQQFLVMAVDRRDGRMLWQRMVHEALPHEGSHVSASLASNSPVTDGERVYAFFGSYGLYCLGFDGELVWRADLGVMHTKHGHGEGASPALYGDTLIVNWDHEGQSYLYAFDKRTGAIRWKAPRDEPTSWATPIVVEHDGRVQVIVAGTNRMRGYDLATGDEIWACGGLSSNIVASPVVGDGLVFAGCSYNKRAVLAVRLDGAAGDVTGTQQVAWSTNRGTPYVPSLLSYDQALYYLSHYQGVLTRVDAATGRGRPGAFRLSGIRNVYASPVGAAGRVYITSRDGVTLVISHDDQPQVLALNQLEDTFSASAVPVGGDLLLRGEQYLYCINERK